MAFHKPIPNVGTTLALDYSPGDGVFHLPSGYGANFGSTFPQYLVAFLADAIDSYGRVTNLSGASVYEVTGRTGDTLSVNVASGYTDIALPSGSKLFGFLTADHLTELQTAVSALQSSPPASALSSLTDVVLTSPQSGNVLRFDGLDWVNQAPLWTIAQVSSLQSSLDAKASQASLDSLTTTVGANTTAIAGKASQASLDALTTTVNANTTAIAGKASQASLDALTTAVGTKADDTAVVHLAGTETISGAKTFSGGGPIKRVVETPTNAGIIVQAAASQSANLQQWTNSSGSVLTCVDSGGRLAVGTNNFNASGYPGAKTVFYDASDCRIDIVAGSRATLVGQLSVAWNGLTSPFVFQSNGGGDLCFTPVINSPLVGIVVKSSGRVGLGIVSPQGKLHVTPEAAATPALVTQCLASQTGNLLECRDSGGTPLTYIRPTGGIKPAWISDANAANDSIYYSTTQSKLVYKDSSGVVNPLY